MAREHVDSARELVGRLEKAAEAVGVDNDADRLETARASRDLLDRVLSADDVKAVTVLANLEPPTSPAAMGRSIKSARQVIGAVNRAHWDVFQSVAELPGDWREQGTQIRSSVRDALAHDELSIALGQVLDEQDRKATQLLTTVARSRDPKPAPGPQPPKPKPEKKSSLGKSGTWSATKGGDPREVLEELLDRRGELSQLKVEWEFRD